MKIAHISTPFERVPPVAYGGTERVVSSLVDRLVKRGHDVTLYATGNSITNAHLRSYYQEPVRPYHAINLEIHTSLAFRNAEEYDLIHNHTEAGIRYSSLVRTPTVHTIHSTFYNELNQVCKAFLGQHFVAISYAQKGLMPNLNYAGVVYNGIDPDELPLSISRDDYLLHIGNITESKGPHHAIQVAKRLGMKLILAGKVDNLHPKNQMFFDQVILPYIDGKQIQFVGEVSGEKRVQLFQHALAVLVPIEWEEPFGLVMVEAMSCGTPVIAFRRGSVPEVVVDGKTGYIVNSVDEMVIAVKKLDRINPYDCREHVINKFNIEIMTDMYEEIYNTIYNLHH